ncbi:MAG: hypothetical protein FWH22_05070 [Fibromonadales bacterium]|nr:hypothetical protein [Fibromonadales bacterium]
MLIANPIYDSAFKHLLENQHVAKFFIGTLLNKRIISISPRSPERTYIDPKDQELKLLRMDFTVEIETQSGEKQKAIIEMQKSDKLGTDVGRFRKYLGREYMSDTIPIISIYVLGFSLPRIETACLRIGRSYYDLIEDKKLDAISDFAERLTHDCYIVQVPRIQPRLKTTLDRLLSVFEQKNFTDKTESDKNYTYPISDAGVKEMTDILHYLSTDPEARKELDNERYYREYVEESFGDLYREIEEKSRTIDAKDAEIASKDAELAELKKKLEKYEG